MTVLDTINAGYFSAYLHGFSAIDFWLTGKITNNYIHFLTDADVTDLAKQFDNLRYPGVDLADAALDEESRTFYFRCVDSIGDFKPSFPLLGFFRDCKTKAFIDSHGIYPLLLKIRKNITNSQGNNKQVSAVKTAGTVTLNGIKTPHITELNENNYLTDIFAEELNPNIEFNNVLTDAALILSKYFTQENITEKDIRKIAARFNNYYLKTANSNQPICSEEQRVFLSELIMSPNPGLGFELLKASGFIKKHWPELAILEQANHSKEFHPEGNAWEHTMETFRHRKQGFLNAAGSFDIRLSLGLLLHDIGKPIAKPTGNHRYDGHAELGEIQARRFLERLGFNASITRDICFLVRNHMLPAALPRLPLFRTEQIMSSDLFPLLMELYRCDESSSFKGLDGYYESSAAYQQFLKNRRNPYRTADGKKLNK